jgi:hypothetical protein
VHRRCGGIALCFAILCGGPTAPALAAEEWISRLPTFILMRTPKGSMTYSSGQLVARTILELPRLSPTFKDLMAFLEASPQITITIAPFSDISETERLIGFTRFRVYPTWIVGSIEVYADRLHPALSTEALAHELAHVVEVACLGDVDSSASLYSRLLKQTGDSSSPRPGAALETGFAREIGKVVSRERSFTHPTTSEFRSVAQRHGLTFCPPIPASDMKTTLGPESLQ